MTRWHRRSPVLVGRIVGRPGSIRTRVLAIALIPNVVLLITAATFVALLVRDGYSARDWSNYLRLQLDPVVTFVSAVQSERTATLRNLGDENRPAADLVPQRDKTDTALRSIAEIGAVAKEINPDALEKSFPVFNALAARIPIVRSDVDLHKVTAAEVDKFYSDLAGIVVTGMDSSARATSDHTTALEEMTVAGLLRLSELHSRSVGFAVGELGGGGVSDSTERLALSRLVGGYRNQLDGLLPALTSDERSRADKLVSSADWSVATTAEDSLGEQGSLAVSLQQWMSAEDKVGAELNGLMADHFRHAEAVSVAAADSLLTRAAIAGIVALGLAMAASLVAVRLANVLVRRLLALRAKTLELADKTLPSMVERLHDGLPVDLDSDLVTVDDGADEIGQVADAFKMAQRTAFAAAAGEAKTRAGINKVFMNIARRSQVVVHQQLAVLDRAEANQDDPEHLQLLFELDHLTTRARRNAENLLILGGGQPGRRWRTSIGLEEIVRSAISETRDYSRASALRIPEVRIVGSAVADVIHLLAELVDNAAAFSPPDAPISVRGNLVGRGVVVEVEDQGLGIRFEERERLNEVLRNPPDFQAMALSGHQHMGLFVIGQLARRHGIAVSLVESAYGGIKAIALLPDQILDHGKGSRTAGGADNATQSGSGDRSIKGIDEAVVGLMVNTPLNSYFTLPPELEARPSTSEFSQIVEDAAGGIGLVPTSAGPESQAVGRSKAPLPKRRRLAHLVPQLQTSGAASDEVAPRHSRGQRSADEARSAMSSFQKGTREGRGLPGRHSGSKKD
ncbi:nitrate- and nitrite sensing domain-containing protein [Nocardia sp. NPDC059239]|uniref:sensor histidine kinase n=1 Tax=unclassified Nocardia TaxID=2637762 RepID=UPI003683901A